jgi:ABC-type multidrug transport system fused ATPase/permease subunit
MASFYGELMKGIGSSQRVFQLLFDAQPKIPLTGGLKPLSLKGSIEFNNICFAYPSRPDVEVFRDLSLSVEQGTSVAVVGPSGSGKSTMTGLLLRYYDPVKGSVLLDGVDVTEYDATWLRENVGVVAQHCHLFTGTIAENIAYADPNASRETLVQAAKEANAHDFITDLPNGYDTYIGEDGIQLSGGQRQRVSIARALVTNPRVLILDEATSSLDNESEALVQAAIERVMKGRTTLIIAHRLTTIRNADVIAVVDDGKITERGSHEELLKLDGMYSNLVKLGDRKMVVSED